MIEPKLVERFKDKIKAEDERSIELMSAGLMAHEEYKFAAGYRRALSDAVKLIDEALDEIMKE